MDMNEKSISEKIAYLKGLAEGMELEDTKEGKLIRLMMDILDDMAEELYDTEDVCDEIGEQLDAVDEDLSNLEDEFYGDDECDCDCCDDECYEVECPNCHEILYLDDEMLEDGKMECPSCGADLEFDFDDDCCCDGDCDCGCHGDCDPEEK